MVVGLIGASIGWLRLVIDDGETVHKGSTAVAVFFLGVFVIGLLLAFIAVVAWGVRFGTESAGPPALKDGPMVPRRPAKRVWSGQHERFTDWDELNKTARTEGGSATT